MVGCLVSSWSCSCFVEDSHSFLSGQHKAQDCADVVHLNTHKLGSVLHFCLGGCRGEYSAPYEELKKQMSIGDSALPSEAEL